MKSLKKVLFIFILAQQAFAAVPTVKVDPKQKFLVVQNGNQTTKIPLGLTEDAKPYKPLYYGDATFAVVILPVAVSDAATTFVYAIDNKGQKLWSKDLGAFNASTPLIEKDFVYLSIIGKVFKIEKQSGKVVWTHEGLFEKYKFNGAEPIQRKNDQIVFSPKFHVNDQTGKLVEGTL